jgi:hypothetical protein
VADRGLLEDVVIVIVLSGIKLVRDAPYAGSRGVDVVGAALSLLVPILAGLIGLFNSFRMMRPPDPAPSSAAEGMALG